MVLDDLVPLWKALADPKRRRLVQLLSDGALTTGELCSHFDVSRYAVMQHLKVLEQAGIIRARREGRQRWNYLNQELLQRIRNAYLDNGANGQARLEDVLAFLSREEGRRFRQGSDSTDCRIEHSVVVQASPASVFRALTEEIDSWWSARTAEGSQMRMEAHVGGRFYEKYSNGGGVLYATIGLIRPGEEIKLQGNMGLAADAAVSVVHLTLTPHGAGTTELRLVQFFHGEAGRATVEAFKSSWTELLSQRLKTHIEGRLLGQTAP